MQSLATDKTPAANGIYKNLNFHEKFKKNYLNSFNKFSALLAIKLVSLLTAT